MIRSLALALCLAAAPVAAQPIVASDFAWDPKPGATVPLDTPLIDDHGATVPLAAAFDGRPVVLDLGYHHCPTLCGPVRTDLIHALRESGLPPDAYRLVVLSIDPAETPADGAAALLADEAPQGSAYFTGTTPAIAAVSAAVGFRSRWDEGLKQFLHPAGVVVLTPAGRVSATLLGVGYSGEALRTDLVRAAAGGIAAPPSPLLLLCFRFDSTTGRYTLAVEKVMRIMAAATVLLVAGTVWRLRRR